MSGVVLIRILPIVNLSEKTPVTIVVNARDGETPIRGRNR